MNIQQTIISGIREQLFFNNYLVLPGFGGFVLKSSPSHLSASGNLLVPPAKTISFNVQLKQNDGLLATWLQNTLKCHASEALEHLKDFAEFCTGILNARRRLSLEGIGFFYLDFENNVCFEPQQDANFLTESFGLAPVLTKPLEPEIAEIKKEPVFVDRTLHTPEQVIQSQNIKRNYRRLVMPVLVTFVFVFLLGLLVSNSSMKGELTSSLFDAGGKGIYAPVDYKELNILNSPVKQLSYVADANGVASIELDETKRIAVKAVESKFGSLPLTESGSDHQSGSVKGKFEIVLGCFTVFENAKRMVSKLSRQKISVSVSSKNNKGMYVVSHGHYFTKEEAIDGLAEIKRNFPNAWIKKDE